MTTVQQEEKQPHWSQEWGPQYQSPYEMWKEAQGPRTIRGWIVDNLYTVELDDWPERGARGVFINLEGNEAFNDQYVCEIPAGKSTNPVRHIYEDTVLILSGRGATTVWYDEKKAQTFEWKERSYFALPPNAWYQHHSGSGTEPVRLMGITAAPRVINTFKDLDFVFHNPYQFRDRFKDEEGYFRSQIPQATADTPEGRRAARRLVTNFIPDIMSPPMAPGRQGRGVTISMINSTMNSHTAELPTGTHLLAHRHGPGIPIVIFTSTGYSLLWKDNEPRVRVDYGPGSLFVPPEMYWHQHFNTGPEPLFHLAAGWGSEQPKKGGGAYYYMMRSTEGQAGGEAPALRANWGGPDVITYKEEDPAIHLEYEAELAKAGITCNMAEVDPNCTQKK